MSLSKRKLLYPAYFIGVSVFFLYYLFPSDAVKDYVVYKISQAIPGINVTIDRISPVLPPGIKLHAIGIAHSGRALIDIDSMKVTPGLLSLFSRKKTARFKGQINAGTLHGWVEADSRGGRLEEQLEGTLSGVQVAEIAALEGLIAQKISGSLDGDFKIDGTGLSRSMTGKFTLSNGRIDFDQPVFDQSSLGFKNVDADLLLNKGTLLIKSCRARGNQLDADISGSIALNRSGRGRTLNLKGSVTPHHGLLAKLENSLPDGLLKQKRAGKMDISFTIGGSVESPEFRLN
jgi:type II secretion system protein N